MESNKNAKKLGLMHDELISISDTLHKQEKLIVEHGLMLKKSQEAVKENKMSYAEALKGSCAEVVERVVTKLDNLPSGNVAQGSGTTEQVMAGMLHSFMEKDKRKLNLVVYNLPEEPGSDVHSKNKLDAEKFVSIVKECLDLDVCITKCYRAGRMNSERPRTLVLTLDSLDKKVQVLESAHKLSRTEWRNVYIAPDRTQKEREVHKKLREELKRRKQEGEEDIIIRKGKIIKINIQETTNMTAPVSAPVSAPHIPK